MNFFLQLVSLFGLLSQVLSAHFFPYGPQYGDTTVPIGDDNFATVKLERCPLRLCNTRYTNIYVNTNGVISFDTGVWSYQPHAFPTNLFKGVAPFWADVDTRLGGNVYYRKINNWFELRKLDRLLKSSCCKMNRFHSTWGFVATWDNVAGYNLGTTKRNSFQAIILTNRKCTFTIFNYGRLDWSKGAVSSNHAVAGFSFDANNYYMTQNSLTPNIVNLNQTTNVGITGRWVFAICNKCNPCCQCINDTSCCRRYSFNPLGIYPNTSITQVSTAAAAAAAPSIVPEGSASAQNVFYSLDQSSSRLKNNAEYILLSISEVDFMAQVRMQPCANGNCFTAIVTKGNPSSDSIQIEINDGNVLLFINGELVDYEGEFTVDLNGCYLSMINNRYVITYYLGVTIQVTISESRDALLLAVSVDSKYTLKTKGLLRILSGSTNSEFSLPDGSLVSIDPANYDQLNSNFVKYWSVTAITSIFTYLTGFDYYDYNNEECNGDLDCINDITSVSSAISEASISQIIADAAAAKNKLSPSPLPKCATPSLANGIVKILVSNDTYSLYQFQCNGGYCLLGISLVSCSNGRLDRTPPTCFPCGTILPSLAAV